MCFVWLRATLHYSTRGAEKGILSERDSYTTNTENTVKLVLRRAFRVLCAA